jgi:hypothetical protein
MTNDHLVCLEDGLKLRSLKRHLASHGMTPEQYRERWNLPSTNPMVAPAYSVARSEMAKQKAGKNRTKKPAKAAFADIVNKGRGRQRRTLCDLILSGQGCRTLYAEANVSTVEHCRAAAVGVNGLRAA